MTSNDIGRSLTREGGWPALHETDQGTTQVPARSGDSADLVETGTTVVGLTTDDAVLLAADRRASLGGRFVSNKDVDKINAVHPTAATASSGAVGHIQQFNELLAAEVRLYESRRGDDMSLEALSTLAGNVLRSSPMLVSPILGGVDEEGPKVYGLDGGGGVLADDYTAKGSGMQLAFGVLEREYEEELDLAGARAVAAEAIESASERDTASGNGLMTAAITADGVEVDVFEALEEVAA